MTQHHADVYRRPGKLITESEMTYTVSSGTLNLPLRNSTQQTGTPRNYMLQISLPLCSDVKRGQNLEA